MDLVKKTVQSYNKFAKNYVESTFDTILQYQLTQFTSFLKGKKVLDAGAGSGRDSLYLKEEGLTVSAIDISPEIAKEAKKKTKVNVKEMNLMKLEFKDKSFDGIWCCASFIHIPKKETEKALKELNRVLKQQGVLYLGLREGTSEGLEPSINLGREEVLISSYTQNEIEELIRNNGLEIITTYIEQDNEGVSWINLFARKN